MGVLPLQLRKAKRSIVKLDGTETSNSVSNPAPVKPRQDVVLRISRADGSVEETTLTFDRYADELEYYKGGGILPYVLRQLLSKQ